ncbi:MAG: hypothetical protein AUK44_10395 [Porphyromonadaceae bacterium CG2_30_38_12]|nr:MAG: hypothetical protein AUK44_10395 [Porphyromonadaceae bacterium CG2_30_38_12]
MQINKTSFRSIYESHYKALYKFLGLYSRDTSQIEDVIQDVFISLWENREKVEIKYIKTYLFHAGRNQMLNLLQKNHSRLNLLETWYEEQLRHTDDDDCFDIELFYDKAQEAINTLPPKCKEIFLLSKEQKMSYKQIASIKNISVKSVENQLGIALKKLRTFLISHPLLLFLFFFK